MTNAEFSDAFDTLLNSYSIQSQFGEGASKFEITLDEYEKSVFLTQAQDQIIKSYFDARLNSTLEGMDTSERRQIDFSSLITVATPRKGSAESEVFETNTGNQYKFYLDDTSNTVLVGLINLAAGNRAARLEILFALGIADPAPADFSNTPYLIDYIDGVYYVWITTSNSDDDIQLDEGESLTLDDVACYVSPEIPLLHGLRIECIKKESSNVGYTNYTYAPAERTREALLAIINRFGLRTVGNAFDTRGILYLLPENILYILNEKLVVTDSSTNASKEYVIKPINYREYDREMSKAYAQPLKKQAWRLFQNLSTGYDITSEIIPIEYLKKKQLSGDLTFKYTLRYIKRPTPIILVDLPNGLNIDGVSNETPCSLNPILHMDILNLAVQLALTTRGARPQRSSNNNDDRQ